MTDPASEHFERRYYEGTASGDWPGVEYVRCDDTCGGHPCLICGTTTDRVEICFEGSLCSTGCYRQMVDEYWAAVARPGTYLPTGPDVGF